MGLKPIALPCCRGNKLVAMDAAQAELKELFLQRRFAIERNLAIKKTLDDNNFAGLSNCNDSTPSAQKVLGQPCQRKARIGRFFEPECTADEGGHVHEDVQGVCRYGASLPGWRKSVFGLSTRQLSRYFRCTPKQVFGSV